MPHIGNARLTLTVLVTALSKEAADDATLSGRTSNFFLRISMHKRNTPVGAALDHWRSWPAVATTLFALFVICGYGSYMDLAYLIGFPIGCTGGFLGLFYLMRRKPYSALSWLLPWGSFLVLMFPIAFPLRTAIFDAGNFARFIIHKQQFEKEVHQPGLNKITFKLWRLGTQGADEIYVLYDATDNVELADQLINKQKFCLTRKKAVRPHFQMLTVSC